MKLFFQRALKYKVATSFDSKEYYKRWRPENMVEQDSISVDASSLETLEMPLDVEPTEEREIGNLMKRFFVLPYFNSRISLNINITVIF